MFTGLVKARGKVRRLESSSQGVRIEIQTDLGPDIDEGDSINVNGVCLTVVKHAYDSFKADVVNETLRRSSLGGLEAGDQVNVEPALLAMSKLAGHIVQGHVDGLGEVESLREEGFARVVRIAAPAELLRYVVEKGSIAVDGVSLTVSAVDAEGFEVSLIPETLERTTLGEAATGRRVNLEVDVVAKYVEKLVAR